MKYLYILGASGSIGTQTLDIVRNNPNEFKVVGMTVGRNLEKAKSIIEEFKPEIVSFRTNDIPELSWNKITSMIMRFLLLHFFRVLLSSAYFFLS